MGMGNWLAGVGGQAVMARAALPKLTPQQIKERAAREAYARQYRQATAFLMTSERATPPRASTVRRMIRCLTAGGPSVRGARIMRGGAWAHPTKCRG